MRLELFASSTTSLTQHTWSRLLTICTRWWHHSSASVSGRVCVCVIVCVWYCVCFFCFSLSLSLCLCLCVWVFLAVCACVCECEREQVCGCAHMRLCKCLTLWVHVTLRACMGNSRGSYVVGTMVAERAFLERNLSKVADADMSSGSQQSRCWKCARPRFAGIFWTISSDLRWAKHVI